MEIRGFSEEEKKYLTPVLDYEVDKKYGVIYLDELLDDPNIKGDQKTMLMFLITFYSYQYEVSFLTIEELMYLFNKSEKRIRKYLKGLEKKGYIKQDKILDRDIFYVKKHVTPKELYENATEEDFKPKKFSIIIEE